MGGHTLTHSHVTHSHSHTHTLTHSHVTHSHSHTHTLTHSHTHTRTHSHTHAFTLTRSHTRGLLVVSALEGDRCRANAAHIRQSRPESVLSFQVKFLKTIEGVPYSLKSSTSSTNAPFSGTSLIRNTSLPGPYSRPMPSALCWS